MKSITKQAQGRTFWVIITMVIALVVLVVLIVIFTGKSSDVSTGLMNCESKGGVCIASNQECDEGFSESAIFNCRDKKQKCCLGTRR